MTPIWRFYDELTKNDEGLFLVSGKDLYVGFGYARRAVKYLADHSVVILGFEGFSTNGRDLEPLLEYVVDLEVAGTSDEERVADGLRKALRTIDAWQSRDGPEFVEFVIDED